MTHAVPFNSTGDVVYVAVDTDATFETAPSPMGGDLAGLGEATVQDLQKVGERIASVCSDVYASALEKFSGATPAELSLEFGVTLGGKTGIPFVAEGKAEGTFKVTATWKKDESV